MDGCQKNNEDHYFSLMFKKPLQSRRRLRTMLEFTQLDHPCSWYYLFGKNKCWLNFHNAKGYSALHYACLHDHHQVVENLIQAGVNITLVDNEGNQPLHIASSYSSVKIVKTLLKHMGDEWFQQNSNNMSALEIAVDLGRADVVCVLISHMHRHLDHHPLCVILSCYSEGLFQKLLQMVSFDTYFCKAHGIPVLIVALINEPHTEENVDTVHNWFSFDFDLRLKLADQGNNWPAFLDILMAFQKTH